jgi:methylenetetrahydrofolate dehydrogenase (NADP+)/methenyltetrahydrofolate cyclohydrolase
MAKIMDGKALAESIKKSLAAQVNELKKKGATPSVATILVGDNPASKIYVKLKERDCRKIGINFTGYHLPAKTPEREILNLIEKLNRDKNCHGIVVQLPVPSSVSVARVIEKINPKKDVDGIHPFNVGKLWSGEYDFASGLIPCAPKGIVTLLEKNKIKLRGKNVAIINRSNLVGKPLSKLLLDRDATVTICHSKTKNLRELAKNADILVTAVGRRPTFIVTEKMVKRGAVVVDVGICLMEGKMVGDVDFNKVDKKAAYITTCPGGVGPMTRAMLLQNVVNAARSQMK